jgi:hypothetical protein
MCVVLTYNSFLLIPCKSKGLCLYLCLLMFEVEECLLCPWHTARDHLFKICVCVCARVYE